MSRALLVAWALAACTPDFGALQSGLDASTDAGSVDAGQVDAASPDAGVDAGAFDAGHDACVASPELCDGRDEDCDGRVDEDVACGAGLSCRDAACRPPSGQPLWARVVGSVPVGGALSRDRARRVSADPGGGVVVVGDTQGGAIDFGAGGPLTPSGGQDAFVAAFDREGGPRAAFLLGGGNGDDARAIARVGAEVVVAGQVAGTVDFGGGDTSGGVSGYAARYSGLARSAHRWVTRAATFSAAHGLAPIGADDVVVVGSFTGTLDLGAPCAAATAPSGATHLFAVRLGADGRPRWCATFGGAGATVANAVAVTDSGRVVVVGAFNGDLRVGLDRHVAVGSDAIVLSLDGSDGAPRWSTLLTGSGVEEGNAVAALPGGDVIVGGAYASADARLGSQAMPAPADLDPYLARLDEGGSARWIRGDPSSFEGRVLDLAVADGAFVAGGEHGGVAFAGCSAMAGAGGLDVFVARFDAADGACAWARVVGGPGADRGGAVAVEASRVYLGAAVNDGAVVDGSPVITAGDDPADRDTDVLVAAYEL